MSNGPGRGNLGPGNPGAANINEIYDAGRVSGQPGQGGFVYMGENFVPGRTKQESARARALARGQARRTGQAPQYVPDTPASRSYLPIDKVGGAWWLLDNDQKDRFRNAFNQTIGYENRDVRALINAWGSAALGAAQTSATIGRNITPWEYQELLSADGPGMKERGGGRGGGGVSSVVDLTNPSDAQLLVDNALTQYLGRRATAEETKTFRKALNIAETKNPIVTTPTQRSGGVNRDLIAREFAESRDDAAEFMVQSQFMNWFEQALSKDPTGGLTSGL